MQNKNWNLIFISWIVATIATLGSLFFSEVMLYPPCVLCWYQRICMYPLVAIFLIGLFPTDIKVFKFSFPLMLIGWLISIYHLLVYYNIIPESASPCSQGVSCAAEFFTWLGFITIPFLSFFAFSLLLALNLYFKKISKDSK